jgi:hypothetical protein
MVKPVFQNGAALWLPRKAQWTIWTSPAALNGDTTLNGKTIFNDVTDHGCEIRTRAQLHLAVTKRSSRAETLTQWVDAVLNADCARASALAKELQEFPIFSTRNLTIAKRLIRDFGRGTRFGLLASSEADRLRANGVEVDINFRAGISFPDWFVRGPERMDSSNHLEVAATEFECQGLELDWTCVCWGNDFAFQSSKRSWTYHYMFGVSLRNQNDSQKQQYARNVYRVLLTRAREGMILFVPYGDASDSTRPPELYDGTAAFLQQCGVREWKDEWK